MANHDLFANSAPSRARTSTFGRSCGIVVLVIATSITLSACGGPGTPNVANEGSTTTAPGGNGSGGTPSSASIAFSRCMRSQAVANFPDPDSSGVLPKESAQQLGVSDSRFQSAQNACKHLLPNGGSGPSQAQIAFAKAQGLKFAVCMRDHGVPLPDPDSSGRIPDPATLGIDQGSPKFEAGNNACAKYRPPYMPSNAQYNAYAVANG